VAFGPVSIEISEFVEGDEVLAIARKYQLTNLSGF
jgi:hypothetical protein